MEQQQRTPRLCSEIQLFDLCDLDVCSHKEGRFCTDSRALERFEAIKEEDEAPLHYLADELDEDEETEAEEYADDYEDDDL